MVGHKNFSDVFSAAVEQRNVSLSQVANRLRFLGRPVDKSTLTRWRSGESLPSLNKLEALRLLGRAIGLPAEENRIFLAEISQALGFKISEVHSLQPAGTDSAGASGKDQNLQTIAFRRHLGFETAAPFEGREKELGELQSLVRQKKSVAITGMGGVGKTCLAQALLEAVVGEFAHGCEFLEISPGQTNLQIIRNVARLLGIQLPTELLKKGSPQPLLNHIQKNIQGISLVFLLDNIDQSDQVRNLVNTLSEITWILTARRVSLKRTGIHTLVLRPPDAEEAARIFLKHCGRSDLQARAGSRDVKINAISERLGRLPLALRLAANLLEYGIFTNLDDLQEWLDTKGFLKSRSLSTNLRHLFDLMLDSIPLSSRHLFDICGLFARPRLQISRLQNLIQELPFKIGASTWEALGDLSLLTYPSTNQVELHPLIHEYARLCVRQRDDFASLSRQFQVLYVRLAQEVSAGKTENERDYLVLLPDEENLLDVFHTACRESNWAAVEAMFPTLTGYLWSTGNYVEYEVVERKSLEAARATSNFNWEAQTLSELGFLKFDQRQWETAEAMFSQAQSIYDLYEQKYFDRARVRRYRALLATARRRYADAESLLDEAGSLLAKLTHESEPRLEAGLLWLHNARMRVLYRQGAYERAEAEGRAGEVLYHSLQKGGGYRLDGFQVLFGDVFTAQMKIKEAENAWKSILPDDPSQAHSPEQADACLRLGWLFAALEQIDQAGVYLESARKLYTRFGMLENQQRTEKMLEILKEQTSLPIFAEFFRD